MKVRFFIFAIIFGLAAAFIFYRGLYKAAASLLKKDSVFVVSVNINEISQPIESGSMHSGREALNFTTHKISNGEIIAVIDFDGRKTGDIWLIRSPGDDFRAYELFNRSLPVYEMCGNLFIYFIPNLLWFILLGGIAAMCGALFLGVFSVEREIQGKKPIINIEVDNQFVDVHEDWLAIDKKDIAAYQKSQNAERQADRETKNK